MSKKPYQYDILSDQTCEKCGRKLKMNLVAKKPTAKVCYRCYMRLRGKRS